MEIKEANILVCVTKKDTYKNLIKKGAEIRTKYDNSSLHILHVTKNDFSKKEDKISEFYEVAKKYNASMCVVSKKSFIEALKEYVEKHNITHIVIGETRQRDIRKSSSHLIQEVYDGFPVLIVAPISEKKHYENVI